MTKISGKLIRPDGQPAAGSRLTLELREAFASDGKIYLPSKATALADSAGHFEIHVTPTPEGAAYGLVLHDQGRRVHTQTITVPDCPEVELTDLLTDLEGFVCE